MKNKIAIVLMFVMALCALFTGCSCQTPCTEHIWGDGELKTAPTETTAGMFTYTCINCKEQKEEEVAAGTYVSTRQDLEKAVVETAWAYYMKGTKIQYDSIGLNKVSTNYGGLTRHTYEAAPEYGTSDTTIYSVCTDFTCNAYYDSIGRRVFEGVYSPGYVLTFWHWMCADNQPEESYKPLSGVIDPVTENDRDMALVRWVNYDRYSKNNAWELPYCEELQVFSSSAFTDWYDGKLEFKKDGNKYSYYQKGKKLSVEDSKELVVNYILEKKDGKYVHLRQGDVFVEDGHALIYIGGDYVLDCAGDKYIPGNGTDQVEEKGAIYGRMKTVESVVKEDMSEDFVLIRPLDYYAKDSDDNPANDLMRQGGEFIKIPEKTLSRKEYPAMDIDRTVNITPYGTAVTNENLTYSVKITNCTDETKYTTWRGNGYSGQEYKDLVVTEKISAGTEFVSATGDYTLTDGVITWKVDISAGDTKELTYTVKVTANKGEVIVNDGGFVANIPSNSISNRVGGAKLTDSQVSKLTDIVNNNKYTNYGADTDFANSVYSAIGKTLNLPSTTDLVENLFKPTTYNTLKPIGVMYNDITTPVTMYSPQKTVSAEYEVYQKMLIDGYYGGYRVYDFDNAKLTEVGAENFNLNKEMNTAIKEFKLEHLEAGDILIYGKAKFRGDTNLTSELSSVKVMVYMGNDTLLINSYDGNKVVLKGRDALAELTTSFWKENDIFFALRPSQAN